MTVNWLQTYLVDAVSQELCTQIFCTTCGAMEFRLGILKALGTATNQPVGESFDLERRLHIARALADVAPAGCDVGRMEAAVRCLLFDLWTGLPAFDAEIESPIEGTWAGGVLGRMKAHHAARQAALRAHEEFQAAAPRRREEKKRLKAKQHQDRLERKKERDRRMA